jgi:hypothetical protein
MEYSPSGSLQGIEGDGADADGEGYITMDELYGYVRRRI